MMYKIRIAGFIVGIETDGDYFSEYCHDFYSNEKEDFRICTTSIYRNDNQGPMTKNSINNIIGWESSNSIFHFFEKLYNRLIDFEVLLMHGAAIAVDDSAYIFTAPSGTGKTTHIQQWLSNLPEAFVVNGDKPFLKFCDKGSSVLACGSPWAGKENMYTNTMVRLKSIVLMERAEDNCIEQITFAKAFPRLLQQFYRPKDEAKMRETLRLMQQLDLTVSFWLFRFNNFKNDCFEVAYNALTEGHK